MNAADRQRIYVDGLKAKIHLLEQSVATQKSELERRARAIDALEEEQRNLILSVHSRDAEIARLRAALKPFAETAERNPIVHDAANVTVRMRDCRAAIKAMDGE